MDIRKPTWPALVLALFSASAAQAQTITLDGPLTHFFGIGPNANHGYMTNACGFKHASANRTNCGVEASYGAWVDGPMNPYRMNGHTYFQVPHSENFRIKVPGNYWGDPTTWSMEGTAQTGAVMTPAQRDQDESHYNNRNWIFGVYNEQNTLYALTHHEWYPTATTIYGIPGFNPNPVQRWIAGIGWAKSADGGASWNLRPVNEGSSRLVLVPQPSSSGPNVLTYGFMHPSNIVKEGAYYYAFTSTDNHGPNGRLAGVALVRTSDLGSPVGWEYWNGSGWTPINHLTYQGNFGPQMPYVFWSKPNDCSHLQVMNVRKHKGSGKWITLGSKWCLPRPPQGEEFSFQAVYSWTQSLANPTDLEGHLQDVQQNGVSLLSNSYYSFFDVDGTADDNYQSVGDHPLLVVTKDGNTYYHQFLTLSGF